MKTCGNGPAARLAFLLFGLMFGLPVDALTIAPVPTEAALLKCLQPPGSRLDDVVRAGAPRDSAFMRVRIAFSDPKDAPSVEVLASSAGQEMADAVLEHVRNYRLPCLSVSDGTVVAVQEFRIGSARVDVATFTDDQSRDGASCVTRTAKPTADYFAPGAQFEYAVVAGVFSGDPAAAPDVRIVYSTGDRRWEQFATEHAKEFRLTCQFAGQRAYSFRQDYIYIAPRAATYAFARKQLGLMEFLGMVQGHEGLVADFDFRTMNCPFDVVYSVEPAGLAGNVQTVGPADLNRLSFLRWLGALRLDFASPVQERAMFGQKLRVQVPCGRLRLGPGGE